MTLVKHRPHRASVFNSIFDEFASREGFFPTGVNLSDRGFRPAVNISNDEKGFGLEFAAPGFDKKDFVITSKDGLLVVKAQKETESKEKKDSYTRKEFNFSSFERSFSIPENVDADGILAKYENGILHITLPKMEKASPEEGRMIEIA